MSSNLCRADSTKICRVAMTTVVLILVMGNWADAQKPKETTDPYYRVSKAPLKNQSVAPRNQQKDQAFTDKPVAEPEVKTADLPDSAIKHGGAFKPPGSNIEKISNTAKPSLSPNSELSLPKNSFNPPPIDKQPLATASNNNSSFQPAGRTNTRDFLPSPAKSSPNDSVENIGTSAFKLAQPIASIPEFPDVGQTRLTNLNSDSPSVAELPVGESFEPGRVLARVGGHPIFVSDIALEANQIIERLNAKAPAAIKQQMRRELISRLLPKYIQSKLLLVDVKQGLPDTANIDEILKSAGDQFDEIMLPKLMERANVKTPAMLDAVYRSQGSSLRKMRQSWSESEFAKFMLKSKINVDPEVSHREMFDYYQKHKDEKYAIKAKAQWEELMVRFDKFPGRTAARDAVAKMGNEVVYGAAFDAVARRSSNGFSAAKGGKHDWTTRGSLRESSLDKAIFEIEVNRLSDIIESSQGFHIIRVIDRTEHGYLPFADAQIEIRKLLLEEKQEKAFRDHVDEVRRRIPVEVYDS